MLRIVIAIGAVGQLITCGNGFIPYQQNGPDKYMVCDNVTDDTRFVPGLPKGLTFIQGIIKGSPVQRFDKKRITVLTDHGIGFFYISCMFGCVYSIVANPSLTTVSAGVSRQVIYVNTPFSPIHFYTDCNVDGYEITPSVSDGLSFDTSLGVLSGVYQGSEKTQQYTVVAKYKEMRAQTVITIEFKGGHSFRFSCRGRRQGQERLLGLLLPVLRKRFLLPSAYVSL